MADNWIKLRGSLMTHPKVGRIADIMQGGGLWDRLPRDVMRDVTVASLCRVWVTTNEHTLDGTWRGVSLAHIDMIAGYPGFGAAMADVGWLVVAVDNATITLPNFLEWNAPAKGGKRSPGASRQAAYRARLAAASDAKGDAPRDVTGDVTVTPRGRDRGRAKEKPPNPRKRGQAGTDEGFEDFWLAWPKSERKQDKSKCLEHWKRNNLAALAQAIVADIRVKRGTRKWAEGYDEAPLTYLRGKRWEDGVEPTTTGVAETGEWFETRKGCEKRAVELGLPKWTETETFDVYQARVRAKDAEAQPA